jgi:hypothetical protein
VRLCNGQIDLGKGEDVSALLNSDLEEHSTWAFLHFPSCWRQSLCANVHRRGDVRVAHQLMHHF